MKLTVLKAFGDNVAESTIEVEDEVEAKGLISAGLCEELDEESEVNELKTYIDEQIEKGIAEGRAKDFKALAKGSEVKLPGSVDVEPNWEKDPKKGFGYFGEFCLDTKNAQHLNVRSEKYLRYEKAFGAGQNEASDIDGGILVPEGFSMNIIESPMVNNSLDLASLTTAVSITGDLMTFPVLKNADQSAAASRFGGVQAYWVKEGADITLSKAQFRNERLVLNKLAALVPMTNELLSDSAIAVESYISGKVNAAIVDGKNGSIINGDGSEECLGWLDAAATGTVEVSRQTTNTLTIGDVVNMVARSTNRMNSVWVINQELYPIIVQMNLNGFRALVPGGLDSTIFDNLMGRPVLWTDHASELATKGDINFVDLSSYITINKNNSAVQTDTSIHLYFLSDQTAFRFTTRMDGQPSLDTAITPLNGTDTLSPFVTVSTDT